VLTKSAKSGIPITGWTYSCGCVCSRLYQSRQTMRSFFKDGGNDVPAQGSKLTLMKGNRNIEQRGPLGKTLPRKTTTTLPVGFQPWCLFCINIYYYKSDGNYYLSTNGNVQNFHKGLICSHHHHERQAVVFSSRTDMDKHVKKRNWEFRIYRMLNVLHSQYTLLVRTRSCLQPLMRLRIPYPQSNTGYPL
jgi:hypothetical protein